MRKLNGLILISAAVMACSIASAQMIIRIDGQPIPTDAVSDIVIMPNENLLEITTTTAYVIETTAVGDGVAITSFIASSYNLVEGQSLTFTWTSNADDCNATGGVDGWAEASIGASGNKTINTLFVGNNQYTLECSDANETVTDSVIVTTTSADAVSITSFTATPNAIMEGETTRLSWGSVNANSCTPTGGTADWTSLNPLPSSGSEDIVISDAGNYSFGLTCTGDVDSQNDSASVIVSPVTQSCDSVTLTGTTVSWYSFWNESFPAPVYRNVTNKSVAQRGYLAIEFNTGNISDTGSIASLENPQTPKLRIGSISQCPGDFNTTEDCRFVWGLGGALQWTTQGVQGACDVDPNSTYYFNITFTDGEDPDSTTCSSRPCLINLQHANF